MDLLLDVTGKDLVGRMDPKPPPSQEQTRKGIAGKRKASGTLNGTYRELA